MSGRQIMATEEEMEFGSMKWKELQALCKKHGIPANKTNRELALLLTIALKVNEAPATQSLDEGEDLDEENDMEVPPKRVRFGPEVETREYEPTACKQKGRITRANAKAKKANPDVHVDEASKNLKKSGSSKGSRKPVEECAEPGYVGRRGKRNAPKGTDSEPMLITESESTEVSGRITRLRARNQSTRNTLALNKEEDHYDVMDAGESLEGAKRYPSRRQCVVIQSDTFRSTQLELKGKTSKRSSKGELEPIRDAQASADAKEDKTEKASAPADNLRRARQNTDVLGTSNVEFGANKNAEASKEDDIPKVSALVPNLKRSRRNSVVLGTNNPVNEVGDGESVVVEEMPTLVIESKSSEASGRITRLRGRSQSTCNTSAVNKEDHYEVNVEGEFPEGAKRYPTRRQCVVTQSDKFMSSEQKLKGKTSKRSRKGKLEANVGAQASAHAKVDTTEKTSAPAENLRRSKRKTGILGTSNIELGANTDAEASEDSRKGDIEKVSAPVASMRSSRQKSVVLGTINPVDEGQDDESVEVEEIPKNVNRKSTRQKSGVLQEDKSKGAQEKLRGKASKVSSNSKLEASMVDEALAVDNLTKVSAPVGNLRRSRRNTNLEEVQKAEPFQVEESANAVDINFSGRSGSDAKELKRKADKLLRNSGLEVIMEAEPSATSKENIKAQKAPLSTGNLRRSRRKTSVLSPISADNAVATVEAVGSLRQIGEQVSINDVQLVDEYRHSSNETGKTTGVGGEIEGQGRKGKRARLGTQVVKRESVVGKPRQSARVNLKSSKAGSPGYRKTAEKEQHTTMELPVTAKEANKSAENLIPVEESPMEVVETGPSESVPDKGSVDSGEKMEGTPSPSFSKFAGSSRHQGLPRSSAVSEKTHTEVAEEVNVGFVSVLSREKLDLLHSSGEGGCMVSPERSKSCERPENLKEISGELSFKVVGALMEEEIAESSRKLASMRQEANPSGDDCYQWARDFAIEDGKDEKLGRNLEMSEELNHGNLGEREQPKIESRTDDVDDLTSENQLPLVGEFSSPLELKEGKEREELHGNEDQSIESKKKPITGDESTEAEVPLNQEETTFGQKFSQAGQELLIKNAANVLKTDNNQYFSLEDDTNEKGGNSRRPKLDKVQTEESSRVKCLVSTFTECRYNLMEAINASKAACARETSNPASANAIAVVQVSQLELDANHAASKQWEDIKSLINRTVASRKDEKFDPASTNGSGMDMVSDKAAAVSAGVAKASATCPLQFPFDDLEAGTDRYQGTVDVHEQEAGGAAEEFGRATMAEDQSELRYPTPRTTNRGSSLTWQNIQASPKETEIMGLNLLFEGQDEEADGPEADDGTLLNEKSRMLHANQMTSKQVDDIELVATYGVSKKWEENSSLIDETKDNLQDETLDIHHMFSPGHEMMSPKEATRSTVGITTASDTHKPQFSIDDLETGIAQIQGALNVQKNEANVEDKLERNYPASVAAGKPSLTLQNVSAFPSTNDIESFQPPWEADSSKLTDDDCQKTTGSRELPDGSGKEGETEMQEVENVEVPLDDTDCFHLNPLSIENGRKCPDVDAGEEDCLLTIRVEVESSMKEDNPPGSSSYCYEQFIENQVSTLPPENTTTIDARKMSTEKAIGGVLQHLAKEEAETTAADLSCCKDAAVSKNDGSKANFIRVLCQEKSIYEIEEGASGQKESTKVLHPDKCQDFCGDDKMNQEGRSSGSLQSDKVGTGRTWVPGAAFSECSSDSPLEANNGDQATRVQEISNQANEKAFASEKDTNATEVVQFPRLADGDRLTYIEESREATKTEIMDVYEGFSKELGKELQEAAINKEDSSLEVTQELVKSRLSIKYGCNFEAFEEIEVLDNSSCLSAIGASFNEEIESMGLNLLFEGQDGEANQVMTSISEQNASSSPGIAVGAHNDERITEEQQDSDVEDDALTMSSPFCIPLTNSFAPLYLDTSPGSATMEVDKLWLLSLSSPPQKSSSNHAGKDGAAIDDEKNLPSPQTRGVEDGRGADKQEKRPWSLELELLGSPKVPRTSLVPGAASGPEMKVKLASLLSSPAFITRKKSGVIQRTTGKILGGDMMKENGGRSKLDMLRQQLGNVTAPPKSLVPGATRRRPLQELGTRTKD